MIKFVVAKPKQPRQAAPLLLAFLQCHSTNVNASFSMDYCPISRVRKGTFSRTLPNKLNANQTKLACLALS